MLKLANLFAHVFVKAPGPVNYAPFVVGSMQAGPSSIMLCSRFGSALASVLWISVPRSSCHGVRACDGCMLRVE